MFDFIFRRRAPVAITPAPAATDAAAKAATLAEGKQAALTQARALADDEAAAAEFILRCEFADARILAAQCIQSETLLQRLLPPMRKVDRRVARLLQQRLEILAQQERASERIEACVQRARELLGEPHLLANQVAELDRAWAEAGAASAPQQAPYRSLRAALEARLLAQAALQRAALDTRMRWRQLQDTLAGGLSLPPEADVTRALAILENAMVNHLAAPEAASLPRHFARDFEQQRAAFRSSWQEAQERARTRTQESDQARAARRRLLAEWQAAAPASLLAAEVRRAWAALPPPSGADQEDTDLEQQFEMLLALVLDAGASSDDGAINDEQAAVPARNVRRDDASVRRQLQEILSLLEAALERGALQEARDCDARLRALALKTISLPAADSARLAAARAELGRLQGWARWSGNMSRADLLRGAQELPHQTLAPPELARMVGALRARWKALDRSAGAAPRELWQQFDAACSAAYAPAAEYFSRQAEQRREHLAQAEALLAQIRQRVVELEQAHENAAEARSIDWKQVALFRTSMQQAWQRLGTLDRQDRKRLQREFDAALRRLAKPLAQQQAIAAARRQELIAAVRELDPAARETPEALRALQQRWQEIAQTLALEGRQEQQSWQTFRAACDAVFAHRKRLQTGADAERHANLQQKQALCQTLEAALEPTPESGFKPTPASLRQLIAEVRDVWTRTGPVPRSMEVELNQRRATALAAVEAQLLRARQEALQTSLVALEGKLALCQDMEQRLASGQPWAAAQGEMIQARWQALAPLAPSFERVLRVRFDAAAAALQDVDRAYSALLESNRTLLLRDILQLEILGGIASPPPLARQRLQVQVEVLAAKLKNGDPAQAAQARLLALCGLPALCDQEAGARIGRLLAQTVKWGLADIDRSS